MNGKLVYGVGVYTKGKHKAAENGRHTKAYSAWIGMLMRCYDNDFHLRQPTYVGCRVCNEWLDFQKFATWYHANYPQGEESCELDKDLKISGNKFYSPRACLIVSRVVNSFTKDRRAARGDCPIGVSWNKQNKKFRAHCRNTLAKKLEHLGYFTDDLSAHLAWRKRKSELAYELAMTQTNPEVRDALLRWKDALDNNEIHTM